MDDLTFVHTSFEKIFCQNKIKKNCKLVTRKLKKKPFFITPYLDLKNRSSPSPFPGIR
jgi:hypothetical protein